jgi:hypothetical protein
VKTCNRYKCSKWSDHVVVPDGGIQDVVVILQRNSGQMIEVPLLAFNYYTLENLIEPHGVFSWVFHETTGENCWLADFDTNLSSIPMDCSEDGVTAEMSLHTLYQDDIKTDLTTSPQEMATSHYFSPMPSAPAAPEAVNSIYMEIPVAYNSFSLAGKEIRVTPSEELQSWRRTYGIKDSAKCIICGINRINRTGPACNKGHVNPKCRGGLGYAVWTFIFQCAECNQVGKRTENTFDQLVERGRNDIILVCSHILFDLYCAAEARLNVEFGGLADFIEKVYGRYSAKSRGGIKNESVFQLLHQEDVTHPMPPEMRNPFLRARSKVERHYYKMLQTQEEMLIKS